VRKYYKIQTFRFAVSTDCANLEQGIDLLYPALRTEPGPCSVEWSLRQNSNAKADSHSFLLYEDGALVCENQDVHYLLDALEWRIMMGILRRLEHFVQVHAAGLVSEGKALLLIGPSGAGKTSLALSLLLQGWKCLSDEVILIDPEDCMISPLPRSFHVDMRVLELFPELLSGRTEKVFADNSGKRLVDPSVIRSDWIAQPSLPHWIVFPSYSATNHNNLIPIGETEALSLLLGQAINLSGHGKKGLEILIQLIRLCQCYRLNTGDLHYASFVLSNLMERDYESVAQIPIRSP
jgi:hypothetical protein